MVDFVANFGAVGDGVTDNSAALLAFGAYGLAAAPATTALTVTAGTFKFNSTTAFTALEGFSFTMTGTGSPTFQNSLASSGPWIPDAFVNLRLPADGGVSDLIRTTAVGDLTVTLLTPAHASLYPIGTWVVVMSEDIQISSSNFSYPPNCNLFDFAAVTNLNTTTGVVTLSTALTNIHKSTNIDAQISTSIPCGKARIWLLDSAAASPAKFNVSHTYDGLTVALGTTPITNYLGMSGRTVTWQNSTLSGISPQIAETASVIGCTLTTENEPDKLVKNLLIRNTTSNVAMVFQSSSIDNVTIDNCTISVYLGSGTAKHILIENSTLPLYGEGIAGTSYGHNLSTRLTNCSVVFVSRFGQPWVLGNANTRTIDGSSITYVNNVITVPKATASLSDWNVVPGVTHLNLTASASNYFTGDLGTVLVQSLTEDATNIYYHLSTGWGATLPAYNTTGEIFISRSGPLTGTGLTGSKDALQLNAATAAGTYPWDLYTNTIVETDGTNITMDMVGDLLSVTITVTNPTATPNAQLWIYTNVVDATTMASSLFLEVKIDLTIAGTRVFTQSALTGKVGTDTVLLNSVSQTTLPAGKWAQTLPVIAHLNFTPAAGSLVVALSALFDPGSKFRSVGASLTGDLLLANGVDDLQLVNGVSELLLSGGAAPPAATTGHLLLVDAIYSVELANGIDFLLLNSDITPPDLTLYQIINVG